ncbi:MAG: hypothetical protein LBE85_10565 [Candidatus Accumulibacter sp.]|nr:hypothetical protein [Accumulibacter sp.]
MNVGQPGISFNSSGPDHGGLQDSHADHPLEQIGFRFGDFSLYVYDVLFGCQIGLNTRLHIQTLFFPTIHLPRPNEYVSPSLLQTAPDGFTARSNFDSLRMARAMTLHNTNYAMFGRRLKKRFLESCTIFFQTIFGIPVARISHLVEQRIRPEGGWQMRGCV